VTPPTSLPQVEVLTFGETMGSLRTTRPLRLGGAMSMSLGGAETNVAIGVARLGHSVRWSGRVGDDEIGEFALRTLRAENVRTDAVTVDAGRPTGMMLLESRFSGVSRAAYYRAGSAGSALCAEDLTGALVAGCTILHLTGITPALSGAAADATLTAARRARTAGGVVSFDVNYRSKLWSQERARAVLTPLAAEADVVIASEDELSLISPPGVSEEGAVRYLAGLGVRDVVVTRGGDGASAWSFADDGDDQDVQHRDAHRVSVVDTVGAGDAFAAGYLSAALDGLPLGERLERAVALGAFAVADSTDWEGLPTRKDLALMGHPAGSTLR